jgi:hypothetical protein
VSAITTDIASDIGSEDRAQVRQARLARSVAAVRRRGAALDAEKVLQVGGSILLPTGLIVILLGWYGASRTSYDFEQMPYLISGGILGAAMTVAGGFLYFGYWLTRLVHEGRRERIELSELLSRIDSRMAVLEASAGPRGAVHTALVATATGTLMHRADCSLVRDKPGLRAVSRDDPGLRPCKVCQPLSDA